MKEITCIKSTFKTVELKTIIFCSVLLALAACNDSKNSAANDKNVQEKDSALSVAMALAESESIQLKTSKPLYKVAGGVIPKNLTQSEKVEKEIKLLSANSSFNKREVPDVASISKEVNTDSQLLVKQKIDDQSKLNDGLKDKKSFEIKANNKEINPELARVKGNKSNIPSHKNTGRTESKDSIGELAKSALLKNKQRSAEASKKHRKKKAQSPEALLVSVDKEIKGDLSPVLKKELPQKVNSTEALSSQAKTASVGEDSRKLEFSVVKEIGVENENHAPVSTPIAVNIDPEKLARPFTAPMIKDESSISLADYKGKVTLVGFWVSWCVSCKKMLPWFNDLRSELDEDKFEVIGVNLDSETSDAEAILAELEFNGDVLNFPLVKNPDGSIAAEYGLEELPVLYLLDEHHQIIKIQTGYNTKVNAPIKKELEEAMAGLSNGKSQAVNELVAMTP